MGVQIGPEDSEQPKSPLMGRKTHFKTVQADVEGKASLS